MTLLDSNTSIVVFHNAAVRRGGNLIWSNGTFSIPTGTISAIVGSNGAGKTTLLNVELGLLPLTQGEVTVLGQPAGVMNHSIGYVPQDYASDIDSNITAEQSVELGLYGSRFGWHRLTKKIKIKSIGRYCMLVSLIKLSIVYQKCLAVCDNVLLLRKH